MRSRIWRVDECFVREGWDPYGIELAEEAAAQIASRFGRDHVFSGPFEKAEFPGVEASGFDAVFMCDFIEHVREPGAVLRKASELLKPGGRLVITTPDGGAASCRLMKASWLHYKTEHLHYFNQKNLPILLRQHGFITGVTQSAKKILDFEYVDNQLTTYPRFLITSLFHMATQLMGAQLRTAPLSFSFGEMIVVATKT